MSCYGPCSSLVKSFMKKLLNPQSVKCILDSEKGLSKMRKGDFGGENEASYVILEVEVKSLKFIGDR